MKTILIIEETIVKEIELEFDENTQTLDSFTDKIKEWHKNGVFKFADSVVSDAYGLIRDKDSNAGLLGFKIK